MRRTLFFLVGICIATQATAAGVAFQYENFYRDRDRGRARVVLKITNDTPKQLTVIAECAFLNGDKRALDTATLIASNVPAKGHAYADSWSARMSGIEHADCRIVSYR